MTKRADHLAEVTAKRHARGEIYSDARVAAINSMGPSKDELDHNVKLCFEGQPDAFGILKSYAMTSFGYALVSQRNLLSHTPDDILARAHEMLKAEEAFATEWLDAIGDPEFSREVRQSQRDTIAMFRTASSGMFLVTEPACPLTEDIDAKALGRAWNKLDSLSRELGVKQLSAFIGIAGQSFSDSSTVDELLPTIESLAHALKETQLKIPSKGVVRTSLEGIRAALVWLRPRKGRAHFEVDL